MRSWTVGHYGSWSMVMSLFKYDLSCVHSHGAGEINDTSLRLRGNVYLDRPGIRQQLVKIQRRDDKIAGTRIGFLSDEVQYEIFASRGTDRPREVAPILNVEDRIAIRQS